MVPFRIVAAFDTLITKNYSKHFGAATVSLSNVCDLVEPQQIKDEWINDAIGVFREMGWVVNKYCPESLDDRDFVIFIFIKDGRRVRQTRV